MDEVMVCPTAGARAIFDGRPRTEHSLEFEEFLGDERGTTRSVSEILLHLYVVDGETMQPVALVVASSRTLDRPPGVNLAFSAAQVRPFLRRTHNAWYFVQNAIADRHAV